MKWLYLVLFVALCFNAFIYAFADEKEEGKEEGEIVEPSNLDKMTDDEMSKLKTQSEPHEFQAEVYRLMDIIINSLYTHKEVFMRELISNAADALEKVRFLAVENPAVLGNVKDLNIIVEYDKEQKTLSVTDTGVGMTKQELISELGTVAKSGTTNFLEALTQGGDLNLIGQFGVGFYSAFLVADKVTVTSKHNDDDQHIWTSTADSSFTVVKDPRGNTLGRGTRITLKLKEDSMDFCKKEKLEEVLTKYSQFVNFPLFLRVEDVIKVPEPDEDKEDVEVTEGEAKKEKKTVDKHVLKLKPMNKQKPIWLRNREELTDADYFEFYRSLMKDEKADEPLVTVHFSAEGEVEFKSLLYVPAVMPSNPYEGFFGKKQQLKLYMRRVLVADEFKDILPNWLNFLRGVVDSDDLPLKVDRESVAQSKVMKVITSRITRKILDVLRKMATSADQAATKLKTLTDKADKENRKDVNGTYTWTEEEEKEVKALNETNTKYGTFWKQYGKHVRLGCQDSQDDRHKIAKLLRFKTSKSMDDPVSLQKVMERMQALGQPSALYYIAGDSAQEIIKSPLIQGFLKKDIEVLLLEDPVDEPCLSALQSFEGKSLKSIEKGQVELEQTDQEREYAQKLNELYKPLLEWWKPYVTEKTRIEGKFGSQISKVLLSNRLVDAPAGVSAQEYGMSAYNEKVFQYQTFSDKSEMHYRRINRTLEINPQHPLIREMLRLIKEEGKDSVKLKESADVIHKVALLASGYPIEDATSIANRIVKILASDMGLDASKKLDKVDVSEVVLPTSTTTLAPESDEKETESDEKEKDEL